MSKEIITPLQRLPRYKRRSTEVECVVTSRDLEILRLVESFRLLASEHIQLLAEGSEQGILRRLHKLFHAGHLDRLRPRFVPGGGSAKMTYAISNKGVGTLQKAGVIQKPTETDRSSRNKELGDLYVAHRLLVSRVRAVLTAACSSRPGVELAFWREGRGIYDKIEVALPERYATVPVAADGFFALRDAKGRTHYFVEADRGTMTLERFTLKLRAYAAYSKAEKHTDKFGIKKFRVLTVASTLARSKNLANAAGALVQCDSDLRNKFLFTSEENLPLSVPESVFNKIWNVPGKDEPCSLI